MEGCSPGCCLSDSSPIGLRSKIVGILTMRSRCLKGLILFINMSYLKKLEESKHHPIYS